MSELESEQLIVAASEITHYPFDLDFYEISFNVAPVTDEKGEEIPPQIVTHKLARPKAKQLQAHDEALVSELINISKREDKWNNDATDAHITLWDLISKAVRGYGDAEDWYDLTPEDKKRFRPQHKVTAIVGMYAATCKRLADKKVSMFGDVWTVRQLIGTNPDKPDFVIDHIFREPNQTQTRRYTKAGDMRSKRGSNRSHYKLYPRDLDVCAGLYDQLIDEVIGGTVGGQLFTEMNRERFLAVIDPVWKRLAVSELIDDLQGGFQD